MGWNMNSPILLQGENQRPVEMAKKARLKNVSKHIAIFCHYIRGAIEHGKLRLPHVSLADNLANILTKGLRKVEHDTFSSAMDIYMATGLTGFHTGAEEY